MPPNHATLIATLGSKPQIITLTLDCLQQCGDFPDSLVVLHTHRDRAETRIALEKLEIDLQQNHPQLEYHSLELSNSGKPLQDVTQPDEVQSAFQSIYAVIRKLKLAESRIHLQIAGGRRTLSVFGMAVAQMLFDDEDCLWHLSSHPQLEASGRLHAVDGEWVRLISIPVIAWGRLSPVFDVLSRVDEPLLAAEKLAGMRLREQWDLARIFILTRLSPAELNVVEPLSRQGLNQTDIAELLNLSPRTVEQHLRSAYRFCQPKNRPL